MGRTLVWQVRCLETELFFPFFSFTIFFLYFSFLIFFFFIFFFLFFVFLLFSLFFISFFIFFFCFSSFFSFFLILFSLSFFFLFIFILFFSWEFEERNWSFSELRTAKPGFGRVLSLNSEPAKPRFCSVLSPKSEPARVRSLEKGTGLSANSEPAEPGLYPFFLRTQNQGYTHSFSELRTETPNSGQKHNPGPSWISMVLYLLIQLRR